MAQMSMILVMGVTGSGKSHFINKLVEGATTEFPGMRSGENLNEVQENHQLIG